MAYQVISIVAGIYSIGNSTLLVIVYICANGMCFFIVI